MMDKIEAKAITDLGLAWSELARDLNATTSLMQTLNNEFKTHSISLAEVKINLKLAQEEIKELIKTIRSSNGNSLVTKVILLEKQINDIEKWQARSESHSIHTAERQDVIRWQIRIAFLTGAVGLVSSILSFFLGHFWK